jgi:hypothetical protein
MAKQKKAGNETELMFVITLLDFCRRTLGRYEPAQAAMLQYLIDDLVNAAVND